MSDNIDEIIRRAYTDVSGPTDTINQAIMEHGFISEKQTGRRWLRNLASVAAGFAVLLLGTVIVNAATDGAVFRFVKNIFNTSEIYTPGDVQMSEEKTDDKYMLSIGTEEDIKKMLEDNELSRISDGTYYVVAGNEAVATNMNEGPVLIYPYYRGEQLVYAYAYYNAEYESDKQIEMVKDKILFTYFTTTEWGFEDSLISSLQEVLNQTENEVFAKAIQAALAEMK